MPEFVDFYLEKIFSLMEVIQQEEFFDNDDKMILVATEKYEDEIKEILDKNDVVEDKYISIGEFFEVAMDEYMKPIWFYGGKSIRKNEKTVMHF